MYSNYLIEVGKLVYIIGDTQNTTQFKNLFQSPANSKQKIFYKCLEQVPSDTFKKQKDNYEKKGIIRKDWFNKILNKSPEMIIMVFNCTLELQGNQLWQDRLKIIIKKINKVFDIMKTNNKQNVRLRIIILISKHTFGGINLHQKITSFLKNYQKDLFVIQIEYYAKQLAKIKSQWLASLQKNYDNKYKKVHKRYQESFLQRKLGCMVKLSILSEMLSSREEKQKYKETYKALKHRFTESIKSVNIISHNSVRELRAVSDVIFLRYLKVLIRAKPSCQLLQKQTQQHMSYFKLKSLNINQTHKYYYYQQLIWRCTFLQNFLQILYSNDLTQSMSTLYVCQLLNQLITYLHSLSILDQALIMDQRKLNGRVVDKRDDNYIGLQSYQGNIDQIDMVCSFVMNIINHKRDYLSKGINILIQGIQIITRYKTMNIFNTNQLLFLNVYLLRFYFQDNKFQGFITIYDQIMKQQISRSNYFLLNQIFNEIKNDFTNITQQQKVIFYGVSCLICDYFQNLSQLQSHIDRLFKSIQSQNSNQLQSKSIKLPNQSIDLLQANQQILNEIDQQSINKKNEQNIKTSQLKQAYQFNLKKKSKIASISCYIEKQFVYIQDQINFKLELSLNNELLNNECQIQLIFNHKSLNRKILIKATNCISQHLISINPLQHFRKDQTIYLVSIKIIPCPLLTFIIPQSHINFTKYTTNKLYTNLRCPQILIQNPYTTYFVNQFCQFRIQAQKLQGFIIDAKFSIKEDDAYGKTEVFVDFKDRINLINSNYCQELTTKTQSHQQQLNLSNQQINQSNVFWLKCNKSGEKSLKFTFHFVVQKIINKSNSLINIQEDTGKSYILRQNFNVTKQIKFTIKQLFKIKKSFLQFSNDDSKSLQKLNIPVDKKILCVVQLQAIEEIYIKQIGHHKNPKQISYLKQISKKDFKLQKSFKQKLNMIFSIAGELSQQIQLFLMSLYIRWHRPSSILIPNAYQNLFLDYQTKINCYINPLSIWLNISNHFSLVKNQVSKLLITITTHVKEKIHLWIEIDGTKDILRLGQKGKEIYLLSQQHAELEFQILPIASGFLSIPPIRVYVDGILRPMNIGTGQIIKCV